MNRMRRASGSENGVRRQAGDHPTDDGDGGMRCAFPPYACYAVIGMVEGRLLFVDYTMRGEKIRIITARKAEPYERRRYHEENREA